MLRGHFDTVHGVTIDKLVMGGAGRAVAVRVIVAMRVIVSATRGHVMIGTKGAVQHVGKCCH